MTLETRTRGTLCRFTLRMRDTSGVEDIEHLPIQIESDRCAPKLHGNSITLQSLQVNSRILFDQMLGRATRLCDFGGTDLKDSFRVFDAVRIFEAIGDMTAMKPVVANPKISFTVWTLPAA